MNLENHRIPGASDAFYIPNFVTPEEEEYLMRKIIDSPRQKWRYLAHRRLQLLGGEISPKNVLIPQELPPFLEIFPDLIGRIESTGAFKSSPHKRPNHVILNEYLPGQGIMPHEDGPSYHPVVATISLGSHSIFHYYAYRQDEEVESSEVPQSGRGIDPKPVVTLLLEPRSVVITSSSLYTSHLHGIQDLEEDILEPADDGGPRVAGLNVPIANWGMLAGSNEILAASTGGTLKRDTRYSLTCRDVEKVASGMAFVRR